MNDKNIIKFFADDSSRKSKIKYNNIPNSANKLGNKILLKYPIKNPIAQMEIKNIKKCNQVNLINGLEHLMQIIFIGRFKASGQNLHLI